MYKYSFKIKLIAYLCICLSLLIGAFLYESSIKPVILSIKKENLDKMPVQRVVQTNILLDYPNGEQWISGDVTLSAEKRGIYEKEIKLEDKKIKILIDTKSLLGFRIRIKPNTSSKLAIFGDIVEYENGKYGVINQTLKTVYKEDI